MFQKHVTFLYHCNFCVTHVSVSTAVYCSPVTLLNVGVPSALTFQIHKIFFSGLNSRKLQTSKKTKKKTNFLHLVAVVYTQ